MIFLVFLFHVAYCILMVVIPLPSPIPPRPNKAGLPVCGNVSDTDKLLLCDTCVKGQLRITSGPESLDIVQSSYVNAASLSHALSLSLTFLQLSDCTLVQGAGGRVNSGLHLALSPVQPDCEGRWLVHLQTRLLHRSGPQRLATHACMHTHKRTRPRSSIYNH